LNNSILEAAKKNKFPTAIAVDAHNSIQGPFDVDQAMKPLEEAALVSLEKAAEQSATSFQVGVARIVPTEFGLGEGMGPGGIAALVVKVRDQKTAYITIDGNNMVTGLREKILNTLSNVGIDEGEVFTTDTHEVNAVTISARGYHPVGEAMDHDVLINYVKQVATEALANLEPAEVAWGTETVSGVKVIGEKQIEALCMLLDNSMKRARKLAVSIFPIAGVVLIALLLLV
jgi:putative membrane protein